MSEQPFKNEDVLHRCRDSKWPNDPNEYIYVKDELLSSGIAVFRLDQWGHYHRQDCDGFYLGMLLRELRKSQTYSEELKKAAENALCILDHIGSSVPADSIACGCDPSVGWVCEAHEAQDRARDIRKALPTS